jgi:hypothetical protein
LAKLKLEGANPVTITTKELTAGFKNSKYLAKYVECVRGHDSMRADMPSHHLSSEQQVGVTRSAVTCFAFSKSMWCTTCFGKVFI